MKLGRGLIRFLASVMVIALLCGMALSVQAEQEGWMHILLMGGDSRDYDTYGRTDSMIILSINQAQDKVKLTSLMRDTWVNIEGHGMAKLNAANVYGGPQLTMQTIEECYGVHMDHYVLVNMQGLATIVDLAGGVDMDISEKDKTLINQELKSRSEAGTAERLDETGDSVHLSGDQAMALCQSRKQDSDYERTVRQRRVLVALAKKLQTNGAMQLLKILQSMMSYVETDLSMLDMAMLASIAIGMDFDSVDQMRLPVDGYFSSGMYEGTWEIRPDFEANSRLFWDFLAREPGATAVPTAEPTVGPTAEPTDELASDGE